MVKFVMANGFGLMAHTRTRNGVSWSNRSELEAVSMAEALNLW